MSLHFEIQADNVKRAVDFYSAVFGWTFAKVDGPARCLGPLTRMSWLTARGRTCDPRPPDEMRGDGPRS